MNAILGAAALVLAGYALLQFRHDRRRARMFACLAIALGLSYAHAMLGRDVLRWLSWGFLALALLFLAQGRRRSVGD